MQLVEKKPKLLCSYVWIKIFSLSPPLVVVFTGQMGHLPFTSIVPGYYCCFEKFIYKYLGFTTSNLVQRMYEYMSSHIFVLFLLDNSPLCHFRCYCIIYEWCMLWLASVKASVVIFSQ